MTIQEAKCNYRDSYEKYCRETYANCNSEMASKAWEQYCEADNELDRVISLEIHNTASAAATKVLTEMKNEQHT